MSDFYSSFKNATKENLAQMQKEKERDSILRDISDKAIIYFWFYF